MTIYCLYIQLPGEDEDEDRELLLTILANIQAHLEEHDEAFHKKIQDVGGIGYPGEPQIGGTWGLVTKPMIITPEGITDVE